jgi:periplasmic protein TonB
MNIRIHATGKMRRIIVFLFALSGSAALRAEDVLIRISEADAKKAAISKANPEYPPMARQMHVAGQVVVEAEVGTDGEVEKVQTVSGNVLLSAAAVGAVKKWKFTPFTAEGRPAKALIRMGFNFSL